MTEFKTTLDQDAELYKLIDVIGITGLITGKVYRTTRPANSTKEDIIISSLTLGDGTIQFGMVNVNIHVPDLESNATSPPTYLANSKRLSDICKVLVGILEEADTDNAALWIESSKTVSQPEIKQHYTQLRVETRFYNIPQN